ncbi:L,D-transpeptidase [Neisseria sp. P0001.S005]|uniref:L,D-transpeptidase n=1 Tax=Neisseria sp. P0001.S005 TaxID=3436649 RepID=UPI003F7E1425
MKKILFGLTAALLTSAAAANTLIPDVSPASSGQHVVINITQQRLFLYDNGKLSKIYPVAVGKAMTQTNLGEHKIGAKAYNPVWHIPKSIQKERNDGVKSVPAGPNNPLGPVFVRLGDPKLSLGIHGTNAPASVPGVRSHGCVRMKSPDALEFAKTIATGAPASVIYQMASLNEDANQNLWLAAYRDPYDKKNLDTSALKKSIAAWAKAHGKTIPAARVDAILKGRTGAANCLTCAKGVKLKSPLKSLAWTSGTDAYSKPKVMPKPAPAKDVVLPQGTEIEVDATDDANKAASEPKQSVRPTPVKPAKPAAKPATTPADAPASAPKAASEPATAPASAPVKEAPASSEPADLLF